MFLKFDNDSETPAFYPKCVHLVLFRPVILSTHSAFCCVHRRGGGHICFSRAVIRIMLISFVLMCSSALACNQYFISSTAVIKDPSQSSSLQHNKRIHPDLESLFSSSPLPNCIWVFISFQT